MPKLNQIIAIEKGVKAKTHGELTELYKAAQKPELFNGFTKQYEKRDDDDADLPSESKLVQFTTDEMLRSVQRTVSALMHVTARKDWTNCVAKASVVIGDVTLIADAPVPYLLFLEKQVTDLHTFVKTLPVLDLAEDWQRDANSGLYKTGAIKTHRTKKIQKPLVLYPATPEHPAQTQVMTEDVIAGFWSQVKQSGAMPKPAKAALLDRVEKLLHALKEARESANMQDQIDPPETGEAIFGYLLLAANPEASSS